MELLWPLIWQAAEADLSGTDLAMHSALNISKKGAYRYNWFLRSLPASLQQVVQYEECCSVHAATDMKILAAAHLLSCQPQEESSECLFCSAVVHLQLCNTRSVVPCVPSSRVFMNLSNHRV